MLGNTEIIRYIIIAHVIADGSSTSATELDAKHIFISYQRDSMASVSKINNKLKNSGFKTWMDIDDMCKFIKVFANNHPTLSDKLKILNESQ